MSIPVDSYPATGLARVQDAAKFLAVPATTVYNMIKAGKIPVQRLGPKTVRIPWEWLHAQTKV